MMRIKKLRPKPQKSITLPFWGLPTADIMVVVDPVVNNLKAKSPIRADLFQFLLPYFKEAGLTKVNMCIVSACRPVTSEEWQSDKSIGVAVKESYDALDGVIRTVKPKLIIPMGKTASKAIMKRAIKIYTVRGCPVEHPSGAIVLPMLGAGHIKRSPNLIDTFITDWQTCQSIVSDGYKYETHDDVPINYSWCTDLSDLIKNPKKLICVDVESRGLRFYDNQTKLLTIQLTWGPGQGIAIPIDYNPYDHNGNPYTEKNAHKWDRLRKLPLETKKRVRRQLKVILESKKTKFFGHNLKFDFNMIREKLGITITNFSHDTLLLTHAIDEDMINKSLSDCVRRWVRPMSGYSDEFDRDPVHEGKTRMDKVPPHKMLAYGCGDTDACFRLFNILHKKLKKDKKAYVCYKEVVITALRAFADIETNGFHIDESALDGLLDLVSKHQKKESLALLKKIHPDIKAKWADSGVGIKLTRADFMIDVLFKHKKGFNLTPVVFTKKTRKKKNIADRIPSTSAKDHLPYFTHIPFVSKLRKFIKNEKMLTTYIGHPEDEDGVTKGFYQYIVGGLVRPTYNLHGTATGRTSCFVGDTPIETPDGPVPIKDIKVGQYVYCYDDSLNLRLRKVTAQARTKKATVCKVTYKTQGRRKLKSVVCTLDHRFRLRDGSYKEAQTLTYGDRCLSLERGKKSGYYYLYPTGGGDVREHVFVHNEVYGVSAEHVHHKDHNKLNNSPDNLEGLTATEHKSKHKWSKHRRMELSQKLSGVTPKVGDMTGKNNPRYYELDKDAVVKALHLVGGKPSKFAKAYKLDYSTAMRKIEKLGIDWKDIRAKYNKNGELLSKLLPKAKKCNTVADAAKVLGVSFYKARNLLKQDNNHIIISVEVLRVPEWVYDISVEEFPNFIANGVCVHNSQDPNGQNFPKRGDFAKQYRRIFIAGPGNVIIEADYSQIELRIAAIASKDPFMLYCYKNNIDIHAATAAFVNGLSIEEFYKLPPDVMGLKRFQAKAVNFGFIYGMSAKTFQTYAKTDYELDFTEEEANDIRNQFFTKYKNLLPWHKSVKAFVHKYKYVRAFDGRVRHLRAIDSNEYGIKALAERQAINSPVQAFANDMGLLAVARVNKEVPKSLIKPIGFIHDAILLEAPKARAVEAMRTVKLYMETNPLDKLFGFKSPIPMPSDVSVGVNLADSYEIDLDTLPAHITDWRGIDRYMRKKAGEFRC